MGRAGVGLETPIRPPMRTTVTLTFAALLAPLAAQESIVEPVTEERQPLAASRQKGFESISADQCREWLTYLASDELRGRETGRPGYRLAADFVAARFKDFGLKPVGDDGTYFQAVPYVLTGPDAEKSYLAVLGADGAEILRVTPGKGVGGNISEKSDLTMEVVELVVESKDDFKDVDVKGKAVIFTDKSSKNGGFSRLTYTLWRAQPGAILTVNDKAANQPSKGRISYDGGGNRVRGNQFRRPNSYYITAATATAIRTSMKDGKVEIKAHFEISKEPVFGANVVGYLEGSDPKLKHEVVGIGSHLDHIGANGDVINNGADDDGSGTTGVLAVAKAFADNGVRPRRSILFMCFSGEEKGLIGSRHYANNPIFPNETMIAELQMDMIGRNEEKVDRRTGKIKEKAEDNLNCLHLVGTEKLSMDLHQVCLDANSAHVGFDFEYDEESVFGRSDHANFAKKDIPIAFFFTGFHPQYHKPDDTVDKIDFPKLARVAKLVYAIGYEIADREKRVVRDRKWAEIPSTRRRR